MVGGCSTFCPWCVIVHVWRLFDEEGRAQSSPAFFDKQVSVTLLHCRNGRGNISFCYQYYCDAIVCWIVFFEVQCVGLRIIR